MKRLVIAFILVLLIAAPSFAQQNTVRIQEIIRADYGSANHWVRVTDRVRSFVQNNSLNFRVNNNTFGEDPSPGRAKVLRLQVRNTNGRIQWLTFRENSPVRLRMSGEYGSLRSRLEITRAEYGAGDRNFDVTARLNSRVQNGRLDMQVNNNTMGGDPARGIAKRLRVEYTYDGRPQQMVINENSQLYLPSNNNYSNNNYNNNYNNNATSQNTTWDSAIIPSGTQISIQTNERIDSNTAAAGQRFSAVIAGDVVDSTGVVRIPNGSDATLVIRSASGGNDNSGSDLVLDVDQITVFGRRYAVSTVDLGGQGRQGLGANKRTAEMVGGGAAVGTLLGALFGGGKGAAIGAGVGAAAGAGTQVLTRGKAVIVPAETVLTFQLDRDLSLRVVR